MDIIGKWKVKQLNIPTLDGVIQCTPDNMPEGEIFEEFAPMANAIFEFTPEGSLDMLLSFSAEELEDAAKHGERVRDGYFVAESKPWKEVDGKFYYLEDIEGEIMGSEIDPILKSRFSPTAA